METIQNYFQQKYLFEHYYKKKIKHDKSWLVHLVTGTKRRINEIVKYCSLDMKGLHTSVDLNIIRIGYYDVIFVTLYCHHKTLTFLDEEGEYKVVRGIPRPFSIR